MCMANTITSTDKKSLMLSSIAQTCSNVTTPRPWVSLFVLTPSLLMTKNISVLKFDLLLLQSLPLNPSKKLLLCQLYINMLQYCVNHVISLIYTCAMTVVKMLSENKPNVYLSE